MLASVATSGVFFIVDAIPTARYVTSAGTIRSFLLGVDCFNATVIQAETFSRHAIICML